MTFSKNIKSYIASLLCLALFFAVSVPLNSKAAVTTAANSSEAELAYDFLKAVGAMEPNEAPYDEDKQITRAYFVKLALHLSNDAPNVLISNAEVFVDVTPSTEYEAYIETAYKIGYISGSATGLFEPNNPITLTQALKILCNILGYENFAEVYGGFPNGYLVVAQRLDLLAGITIDGNSNLDMANAMLLMKNAANTEVMQIASIGDDLDLKSVKGETLLYINHGIASLEGIVNANAYTNLLYIDSELAKNQISIDDVVFNDASGNMQDYIGYNVTAYYENDISSSIKNVRYLDVNDNNKIDSASSVDVVVENGDVSYYVDDDTVNKLKISTKVSYIVNGKMTIMDADELPDVEKCFVTFISNNGDSTVDVVKAVKYQTFVVNAVSASSGIIVTNDGTRLVFDSESDEYTYEIFKNGFPASLDSLASGDIILVSEGANSGYRHISILASDKTVNASFDEIGADYAVVEGVKYNVDSHILDRIKAGTVYKISFDSFDNISYVKVENDMVYGFLYAVGKQGIGKPQCRIFTENDRWVTLDFADKVKYNGTSVSADKLYTELTANGDEYKKLIRYNVNELPQLTKLETYTEIPIGDKTEKESADNDIFRLSYSGSLKYRGLPKSFNGKFFVDSKTKVFFVPQDLSADKFKVRSISSLKNDGTYTVDAFNVNEYLYSGVVSTSTFSSSASVTYTDKFMIVKNVGQILNIEGEPSPSLRGYRRGDEIAYAVDTGTNGVDTGLLNSLKKGDVIHYSYDENNNIVSITKYPVDDVYYSSSSHYASTAIIGGEVINIDTLNRRIRLKYTDGGDELGIIYNNSTSAALWDKATQTYRLASASEIIPGDVILANTRYHTCYDIVIIRG